MPEFHFDATKEDALELLQSVFQEGEIKCTPCDDFRTRRLPAFRKITDTLLAAIEVNSTLYLTGSFTKRPLFLMKIRNGKHPTYSVDETRGGPAITLDLPSEKKLDGKTWHLLPGSLHHYPHYWDDAITTCFSASEELRAAYREIVKKFKKRLLKRKIVPKVWIGHRATKLLENDGALLLDKGKWWNNRGKAVKSNTNRASWKVPEIE